jgi:hypothetical protein
LIQAKAAAMAKITPSCRSVACLQRRYREAAKQRSCAKKKLNFFAQLRCFAVKLFGCPHAALGALRGE